LYRRHLAQQVFFVLNDADVPAFRTGDMPEYPHHSFSMRGVFQSQMDGDCLHTGDYIMDAAYANAIAE
jgi:hypothetical protein